MKILILVENFMEDAQHVLQTAGHEIEVRSLSQDELESFSGDAEALVVRVGLAITETVLAQLPHLRVIATATTGLNHIDLVAARKRGIDVLSLKDEREFLDTITSTAELALGMLLDLARKTPWAFDSIRSGEYALEKFRGRSLYGKTLGVIGMGRLGTILASAALGLRMQAVFTDPNVEVGPPGTQKVSLDELLATSDAVSLHMHLSTETEKLINAVNLAKMKQGAYLINTSRGEIVDETAVLASLESGHLGGYATDVLAGESTLIERGTSGNLLVEYAKTHDNCLILPHTGGLTFESRESTDLFIANKLRSFVAKV